MVVVGTSGKGGRFLKTDYPSTEGLELGTTKLKDDYYLIPEDGSNVPQKDKEGL